MNGVETVIVDWMMRREFGENYKPRMEDNREAFHDTFANFMRVHQTVYAGRAATLATALRAAGLTK